MRLNAGLAELSQTSAAEISRVAPMLAAIGIAPGVHLTGIGWPPDLVITADQALPAQESYSTVLPGGALVAGFVRRRNPATNLAALQVPGTTVTIGLRPAEPASVGDVVVVVGANPDATPTARFIAIHSVDSAGMRLLDAAPGELVGGSPVLDSDGALLGLCITEAGGAPRIAPHAAIVELLGPASDSAKSRRGWIGAALQPVTIARALRAAAGQTRGRLVLSLAAGGPAQRAGVQPGDIVLAVNGKRLSGPGSLRALLGSVRIGREIELLLARDGEIGTQRLVVEAHPGD
ncbi:MAG TPA: PDZ domain-containing protein [Acetobacteraceae bacterium]|nr:PDZ domain-containing protein [Acetobacteraceae bacterium]